jgi:hypothetical protein
MCTPEKELEVHWVEKVCLICDSDAPQVGSAWSNWTGVIRVNHRKQTIAKQDPTVCVCIHTHTHISVYKMATNNSHMQDKNLLVFPHFIRHGTNSQHTATCYHVSEHICGWGLYLNFTLIALSSKTHVYSYNFLPFLARTTYVLPPTPQ